MELLSPAGNIEKLYYAYKYGADAAYIGIKNFSLRAKADNFKNNEWEEIKKVKGDKKLYCALNIFFHNEDLYKLEKEIEYFQNYPFDAFIISDLGLINILKKYFPNKELHLSTQANCTNYESAKMYRDLGFSRVILGREVSLKEIHKIKSELPDLELEAFVHGAMCLAYSGRCFLSKHLSNRSGNKGDCAHSCRWKYKVHEGLFLEEEERPNEYFPIIEGENFTSILSSKDMCMIDHIKDLKDAGIDSLKVEGRMKSIYYAAIITRAYRKMIDSINGQQVENLEGYREEIFKVSHREFSTGFFYGKDEIEEPTEKSYLRQYKFLGSIIEKTAENKYKLDVKNQILASDEIEYIGPDVLYTTDQSFKLLDEKDNEVIKADHGKEYYLITDKNIDKGFILRKKNPTL